MTAQVDNYTITGSIRQYPYPHTPLTTDSTLSVDNTLYTILTVHNSVVPLTSHVSDHHHLQLDTTPNYTMIYTTSDVIHQLMIT